MEEAGTASNIVSPAPGRPYAKTLEFVMTPPLVMSKILGESVKFVAYNFPFALAIPIKSWPEANTFAEVIAPPEVMS